MSELNLYLQDIGLSWDLFKLVLIGAKTTIIVSLLSVTIGMILGVIFLGLQKFPFKPVAWFFEFVLLCLRGLPEIVMVFLVFYGIGELLSEFDIELTEFWAGVMALSLVFGAYASQSMRGAIESIPQGQWLSAKAAGLNRVTTFFGIIMPQMWRQALPGLVNQWLALLKDSSLVSTIGIGEIIYYTNAVIKTSHKPFTWYIVAAILYLIITFASNIVIKWLDKKANYYTLPATNTSRKAGSF